MNTKKEEISKGSGCFNNILIKVFKTAWPGNRLYICVVMINKRQDDMKSYKRIAPRARGTIDFKSKMTPPLSKRSSQESVSKPVNALCPTVTTIASNFLIDRN